MEGADTGPVIAVKHIVCRVLCLPMQVFGVSARKKSLQNKRQIGDINEKMAQRMERKVYSGERRWLNLE